MATIRRISDQKVLESSGPEHGEQGLMPFAVQAMSELRLRWCNRPSAVLGRVALGAAGVVVSLVAVISGLVAPAGAATVNLAALVGRYTGNYFVGGSAPGLTFYVAPGGSAIQDVSASVNVTCSPGNASVGLPFVLDSIPLTANGAFEATAVRTSDYHGNVAREAFTFQGGLSGLNSSGAPEMAGSLSEIMTYNDGVARTCTSTNRSWSTTRESHASPQPTTPPPSGRYTGNYFVGGSAPGLTFYVAPGGTALQDVSASVGMTCSPGDTTPSLPFVLDSIPLLTNRSFGVTAVRTGDYRGNVARETFTLQGHVHGLDQSGTPRLAGSLTETMTYSANGASVICISNELPWYVTRELRSSPQPTTAPPSGSYSGNYFVGGSAPALTFYVAPGGTAVEDVSASVGMTCSPGNATPALPFVIDSIALPVSRSFSVTTTRTADYQGTISHETFTFQGHLHGLDQSGAPRLAGSLNETMTYTKNGTLFTCGSNELPWYAARGNQPSQPTTPPSPGSYFGNYFVGGSAPGLKFNVASSRTAIEDVSAMVSLTCTPTGTVVTLPFAISSLALPANGSFATISASSIHYGVTRMGVTVAFRGHVHGLDRNGAFRMAGSLIETAIYSASGVVHSCTSGELPWYAVK